MPKSNDLLFKIILSISVFIIGIILIENIYNSIYPPLFIAPKIDVEKVSQRIKKAGLTPIEAKHYRVLEIDRQGNIKENLK